MGNQAAAHRPVLADQKLASILSYTEQRQVTNDYTISWMSARFQIPLTEAQPGMRKQSVRVEQRLDGSLCAVWRGKPLSLGKCIAAEVAVPTPHATQSTPKRKQRTVPNHAWMSSFWHGDPVKKRATPLPAIPVALRAPFVTGNP